jgi:probable addiction module antidote protein
MNRMRSKNSALPAPDLATERDVIACLKRTIDGEHPDLVVPALKNTARSKGIAAAARRMRMTQTELRAQVLPKGRPKLDVAMKMMRSLGLRFTVSR